MLTVIPKINSSTEAARQAAINGAQTAAADTAQMTTQKQDGNQAAEARADAGAVQVGSGASSGVNIIVGDGIVWTMVPASSGAASGASGGTIAGGLVVVTATVTMPKPENAVDYLARGNVYNNNGNYEEAAADYKQAIQKNPKLAEAYLNLGIIENNSGDSGEALSNIIIALKLDITLIKSLSPDIVKRLLLDAQARAAILNKRC